MAGSVSQELEDLLNPQPKFADPEDDEDEATRARVVERFTEEEEEEEEDGGRLGALRRRNTTLLCDTDSRYLGKPVSRKQLAMGDEGSEEEDDDDDEEEIGVEEEVEGEEEEEGSLEEDEEEEENEEGGDDDDDDDVEEEGGITLTKDVDFHKLTEGMDDLGVSEEEEEEEEEEDDDDYEEDDDDDDEMEEEDGGVRTFSQDKVEEEVEKGMAVRKQLALWDHLLEGRIKVQKVLVTANQLPQPDVLPEFRRKGGEELAGAMKSAHKALKALQRSLLELHDQLLLQDQNTRTLAIEDEEDGSEEGDDGSRKEVRGSKRKLEMSEYPELMAKRFAAFTPYRDATLQKWHDKTRLTTGKSGKGFAAFERNILTQVEQVLMDQQRLLRRTQTRRSEYRILGKKESVHIQNAAPQEGDEPEGHLKVNQHLKDLDEDVFDDDDFYHQLLRELIERRTSATDPNDQVAMGRQWLAIQKLRSKMKKKVDTKASKGRKVRFHLHSKLVNFMAPVDHSAMSDEARSELYRGLFGQHAAARE